MHTTAGPRLQVFLVSGITQNRSDVRADHQSGGVTDESGEVPDIHFVLDHHRLQPLCSKSCPQPIKSVTASLQFCLAEFHGGNVGHGGEYTDLSGNLTGDLSRFWVDFAPICVERAAITRQSPGDGGSASATEGHRRAQNLAENDGFPNPGWIRKELAEFLSPQ